MYSNDSKGAELPDSRAQAVPICQRPMELPMAGHSVRAGFPSPAEDFHVERLDLTSILVTHPQATFFIRLSGDSMVDAGLFDGDLMVVNRALKPQHQDVVIAVLDGEFTCKHLWLRHGRMKLVPANPTYPEIIPQDGQTVEIWGVVTASIKRFRQNSQTRPGRAR